MDDWNKRIEDKIDFLVKEAGEIKLTQVEHHIVLKEHTRRSLANEKSVEILKEELKPVFRHVIMLQGVGKFLGVLGVIAGIAEAFILWFKR